MRYLIIKFTGRRNLKQSPLTLVLTRIMKVSINVLFENGTSQECRKHTSSHALKTGSLWLLDVFFSKFPTRYGPSISYGSLPRGWVPHRLLPWIRSFAIWAHSNHLQRQMAKGRWRIKVPLFYKLAETTNAMFIALWIGKIWFIHAARARFSKVWYLHCRLNRHAYGHIGLCRHINPPYFSIFNCLILWWSQNFNSCIYMFSVSGYKITLSYKRENPDFRHLWSCTLMHSTTASGTETRD